MAAEGMRVTVLGAYGAVGRRLVAAARALGHRVVAAGRRPDELARVPADDHVRLGITDHDGIRSLARTQDVVVNATGIEDPDLAVLVTSHGAAFMDLSAEGTHLERLARVDPPDRPVVAGVGLAPGLTNLLAAMVPGTGPIHIGIVAGVGEQHGEAGRRWVWESAGRPVDSGGTTQHVYRSARRFRVPGLGRRSLLRAGFGEQDQLASDLGRPVSTWLGLDPGWVTPLLGLAGLFPAAGPHLDRASAPVATLLRRHTDWHVVVGDATRPVAWASGRLEAHATATVAALFLDPLVRAEPRVHAAHHLVTVHDLRAELARSGIRIDTLPHLATAPTGT